MEQHSTSMALIESSQAQKIPLQEAGEDGKFSKLGLQILQGSESTTGQPR